MKNILVYASLLLLVVPFCCIAQDSTFLLIKKSDLKKYSISKIETKNSKLFFDPYSTEAKNNDISNTDIGNCQFTFINGRLVEIASKTEGGYLNVKYSYLDSAYLSWWTNVKKHENINGNDVKSTDLRLQNSLNNPYGLFIFDRDGGGNARTWPCFDYEYSPRLKSISVSNCSDTRTEKLYSINFFYYADGRLHYSSTNKSKSDSYDTYYIYKNNFLIGYYPAKQDKFPPVTAGPDTIYTAEKNIEIKKIGFEKFKKKYFKKEVYNKIIEDCFEPVKTEQILINSESIKTFLSKIGSGNAKYLVLEITDNYFLFYKLID